MPYSESSSPACGLQLRLARTAELLEQVEAQELAPEGDTQPALLQAANLLARHATRLTNIRQRLSEVPREVLDDLLTLEATSAGVPRSPREEELLRKFAVPSSDAAKARAALHDLKAICGAQDDESSEQVLTRFCRALHFHQPPAWPDASKE
jgi:hypothetical protein